jgi:hypothetical protein
VPPSVVEGQKSSGEVPFAEEVPMEMGKSGGNLTIGSDKAEVASSVEFPGIFIGVFVFGKNSSLLKAHMAEDVVVIGENPVSLNEFLFSQSW